MIKKINFLHTSFSVLGTFSSFSSSFGAVETNSFFSLTTTSSSKLIVFGFAFFPSKNSSAVNAGSPLNVGGNKSAWNASD